MWLRLGAVFKSRTDSRPKGSRLQLGHLEVGDDDQYSQAEFESRLEPDHPSLNSYYNWPSDHWPCVKSCLVGGRDKQITGQPGWARKKGIWYLFQQHGVCILTTKPSCRIWGLCPYHQQKTWNPINHSHEPRIANQTNHSCPFLIQTALLRANLRESFNLQIVLLKDNLRKFS